MAGIDKTYVDYQQYKEVKAFFNKDMKKKQKEDLGYYFGHALYKKSDFDDVEERVIWNTPTIVDLWLANNCKLDFVQERLHEQYGDNWIGWHTLNFNEKGFILSIEHEESYVAPFRNVDENTVEVFDTFLLYGTTYFNKFLYTAMGLVRGESDRILIKNDKDFVVYFEIFGLHLKAVSNISSGTKYYLLSENSVGLQEIGYAYFPTPYLFEDGKDKFFKFFEEYKIKHSYKKSDFKKYKPEQIIMSNDNECFSVDMYKDFNPEYSERYFCLLPQYINIK
jgi:hypothetical protein